MRKLILSAASLMVAIGTLIIAINGLFEIIVEFKKRH
jgi:uncharacterized membrane protein HdeD (DUF308 family)